MKDLSLCDAAALQPFVGCLENRGLDAARFLERSHLSPEQVAAGQGKIYKRQGWQFFQDIVRAEGVNRLGFLDNEAFHLRDLGSLGTAVGEAVSLLDALRTFRTLVPTFAEGNDVWLEVGETRSWLYCRTQGLDADAFVPDQFTVLVLTALVRAVAGEEWQPEAVSFQGNACCPFDEVDALGDAELLFNRTGSGVAFETRLLPKGLVVPSRTRAESMDTDRLPESLREIQRSRIRFGDLLSANEASEVLGVSRTTLFRRLKAYGIDWSDLIERVRYEEAVTLLADSQMSIKEIAYELGYFGPNNFIRFFKRMSGLTPNAYREQEHAQHASRTPR